MYRVKGNKSHMLTERRKDFKCEDCDCAIGKQIRTWQKEKNHICRVTGEFPTCVIHCKELIEKPAAQPYSKCLAKKSK